MLAVPVVGDDEDVAGERHAFPTEEKRQRVAGAADEHHAAQEHVQREHLRRLTCRSRVRRVRTEVGRTVHGRCHSDDGNDEQEVRGQTVYRKGEASKREKGRERLGQRARRALQQEAGRKPDPGHGPRKRSDVAHAQGESTRPACQDGRERACSVARRDQIRARTEVHATPFSLPSLTFASDDSRSTTSSTDPSVTCASDRHALRWCPLVSRMDGHG